MFSWEPTSAAGTTVWSNITFGAQLCLDQINSTPAQPFSRNSWLGTWDLDHDGWQGQLTITGFGYPIWGLLIPVAVTYAPTGGISLPTEAVLWAAAQHHMTLFITFPGNRQQFELYHHTWEADLFSGTTVWAGITFGAKGQRQAS